MLSNQVFAAQSRDFAVATQKTAYFPSPRHGKMGMVEVFFKAETPTLIAHCANGVQLRSAAHSRPALACHERLLAQGYR